MASIIERKGHYCVVYNFYDDKGNKKQRWETFKTAAEAKKRKKEVEYRQEMGSFVVPQCKTMADLLREYVALYGKNTWALSTYQGNVALIENYIIPVIGHLKLNEITTRVLEKYYQQLLRTKAVGKKYFGKESDEKAGFVSASTVKEVNKILRNCFNQAIKWELMEKNPCVNATLPKVTPQKREIWTADTLFQAIDLCDDTRLKLALNITFSCSLRIGELLGLTWDCVDVSPESIANGTTHIYVNKEIQRVNRDVLETLEKKDVITIFPSSSEKTKTLQILKTPKTISSIRKVYLPRTVAEMLVAWKIEQDEARELLGSEYTDYNLVFAGPFGMPTEGTRIRKAMQKLIEENDLPPVVFHSLRHSSITYKLKLNGGDIKAVQGDSGHSQAQMVTDQYSHIIDENRAHNAQLFEEQFYQHKETSKTNAQDASSANGIDPEVLSKVLQNPDFMALLQALSQKK